MIFLTQSLFVFSQDLLADMLIFITRCSNFFFFYERRRLWFGASPASPCVSPGGARGGGDPPYRVH